MADDLYLCFRVSRGAAEVVSLLSDALPVLAEMARKALLAAERLPGPLAAHREELAQLLGAARGWSAADRIAVFSVLNPAAWRQGCEDFRNLG